MDSRQHRTGACFLERPAELPALRRLCRRSVADGRRPTAEEHQKGWFVAPTVFASAQRKMRIPREEIFGS